MAKEVKKGTKKVAAKPVAKKTGTKPAAKKTTKPVAKKAPAKKTVAAKPANKINVIQIVYMFLLVVGVSLVMVSLILRWANYIETSSMLVDLAVALVALVISAFLKKYSE